MELKEKAAYLKGLVEGLGIDETTKEGKVIKAMSELLCEMAQAVDGIDEDVTQAYDQINDLSEELEDLEADLYEDDDADEEDDEPEAEDDADEDDTSDFFSTPLAFSSSGVIVLSEARLEAWLNESRDPCAVARYNGISGLSFKYSSYETFTDFPFLSTRPCFSTHCFSFSRCFLM